MKFIVLLIFAVCGVFKAAGQCSSGQSLHWTQPSVEIIVGKEDMYIIDINLSDCQQRCINPEQNDINGCKSIEYDATGVGTCILSTVNKNDVDSTTIAASNRFVYSEWYCERSGWIRHTTRTTTTSTTPPVSTTQSTTTTQSTPSQGTTSTLTTSTTVTTSTTTTLPPDTILGVQVKFQGDYDATIGNQRSEWEAAAYPQIATAGEVSQNRIQNVALTPGSVQLDFQILPSANSSELRTTEAAENIRRKIEDGSFTLTGPTNSVSLPPEQGTFLTYRVETQTQAPQASTSILALKPVYIVMIAMAIVITLLLITSIVLILLFQSRDNSPSRRHSAEGAEDIYHQPDLDTIERPHTHSMPDHNIKDSDLPRNTFTIDVF